MLFRSDELAQAILLSPDAAYLDRVADSIERQLVQMPREKVIRTSLENRGAMILVRDATEACRITNRIAPEHLEIITTDPERELSQIVSAGATFLGPYSPVAVGDYAAGPSHVLPTGGTARWAAGLTANDFLRGGSVITYSRKGLQAIADDVRILADKEGLTAHRASIDIRLT